MAVIIKENNGLVTNTYFEIIGKSLSNLGEEVKYVDSVNDALTCNKNEIIVCALPLEALRLILCGYRHIIYWYQGLPAEECFLVQNNRIKYYVWNMIEWFVIRHLDFILFVSETMKSYVSQKNKINLDERRCYVMPCMNTTLHPEAFIKSGKYQNRIFAYVGSLTKWQSFEETAALYKKIEEAFDGHTLFKIFTWDQDEAKDIIDKLRIQNYEIDYVNNTELPTVLADVKYGFILRKDNIVNRVATPTKISSYLSCGVIPIYSDCLEDFSKIAKEMKYAVSDHEEIITKLKILESDEIYPDDILQEYERVFNTYYNQTKHMSALTEKLRIITTAQ